MDTSVQLKDSISRNILSSLFMMLKSFSGRYRKSANGKSENIKILQSRLVQAQKMESVGKLAGGIAHDFNNIMTTIIGYSELIQMEDNVDEKTLGYIKEIHKSSRRAASLTQQLLAFSRKQILKSEIVDLNFLVKDTERMLRVLLYENVKMSSNLPQALCLVKVDPGQIVGTTFKIYLPSAQETDYV